MKKKIFSFVLLLCLVIPCAFMFSGCQALKNLLNKKENKEYTLNIENEDGEFIVSRKFHEGENFTNIPNLIVKEGYGIAYWVDKSTNKEINLKSMPGKNMTIYPKLGKIYNITYENVTDTFFHKSKMKNTVRSYISGAKTLLPTGTAFEEEYLELQDFEGWYDNAELKGERFYEVDAKATGDLTFYAKWNSHKFKINYNYNSSEVGDIIGNEYKSYDCDNIFELPNIKVPGYSFSGWKTEDNKDIGYSIDYGYKDKTVYGNYRKKQFTIYYTSNVLRIDWSYKMYKDNLASNGNYYCYEENKVYSYGDKLLSYEEVFNEPLEGYVFKYWECRNADGEIVKDVTTCIDFASDEEPVYVTAVWEEIK